MVSEADFAFIGEVNDAGWDFNRMVQAPIEAALKAVGPAGSVTGELFAVINAHSVLVRADVAGNNAGPSFEAAIGHVRQHPQAALSQLLFECRSRQMLGNLARDDAPGYLSGLIIGQDILAASRAFADVLVAGNAITVVASTQLAGIYRRACTTLQIPMLAVDGTNASLAGLTLLHSLRTGQSHVA